MDIFAWLAIAITFIVFLGLIVAAHIQSPDDAVCVCKPAKFCSQCGKRLSDVKSGELM